MSDWVYATVLIAATALLVAGGIGALLWLNAPWFAWALLIGGALYGLAAAEANR